MSYQIWISPHARRELNRLRSNIYLRLQSTIDELANNPRPRGSHKLAGRTREWRIRVTHRREAYR